MVGPMLLFERNSNVDRRFFACSAYRDRKLCSAYVLEADWKNDKGRKIIKESQLLLRSRELDYIRDNILCKHNSSVKFKSYCHSCGELFVDDQHQQHLNHKITKGISEELLVKPSEVIIRKNFIHDLFLCINHRFLIQVLRSFRSLQKGSTVFFL